MLRLSDIALPLDHPEEALAAAIVAHLYIAPGDLLGYSVFKRSYDARNKARILLVYQLDVELPATLETQLLEQSPPLAGVARAHRHDSDDCGNRKKKKFDLFDTTFLLGRETLLTTGKSKLPRWRKELFAFLSRNATPASHFFGLPPNRVVELGAQIEL